MSLLKFELYKMFFRKITLIFIVLSLVFIFLKVVQDWNEDKMPQLHNLVQEYNLTNGNVNELKKFSATEKSNLYAATNLFYLQDTIGEQLYQNEGLKNDLTQESNTSYQYKANLMEQKMLKGLLVKKAYYFNTWGSLINNILDFPMAVLLILIMVSGVFSVEYASRMDALILSSKQGKRQFIRAKIVANIIFISIVFLSIVSLTTLVQIFISGFDGWNSPIQSLLYYQGCPFHLNILQYYLLGVGILLMGLILFSMLVLLVSTITKRPLTSFFITIIISFLSIVSMPRYGFLKEIGVYCDFLRPLNLFRNFSSYNIFGTPVLNIIVEPIIVIVISIAAVYLMSRTFRNHQVVN